MTTCLDQFERTVYMDLLPSYSLKLSIICTDMLIFRMTEQNFSNYNLHTLRHSLVACIVSSTELQVVNYEKIDLSCSKLLPLNIKY